MTARRAIRLPGERVIVLAARGRVVAGDAGDAASCGDTAIEEELLAELDGRRLRDNLGGVETGGGPLGGGGLDARDGGDHRAPCSTSPAKPMMAPLP